MLDERHQLVKPIFYAVFDYRTHAHDLEPNFVRFVNG